MTQSSDGFSDLAEAVAEGAAIDWSAVESTVDHADLPMVRALRDVEHVIGAHRRVLDSGSSGVRRRLPRLVEGDRWGHLEIRRYLGGGGFGDVYEAFDPRVERRTALKLLWAPEEGDAAMLQEARLLAKVSHQNVVRVYGADQLDGQVGISMELLHGHTLTEELDRFGPLGADEAVVIGMKLCDALAEVHRQAIVHRDVKAQNVMREPGGRIVLMDFGIGLDQDSGRGSEAAGTPAYLAPELLAGGEAGVTSDIYALGVLLFHLVTGDFPVRGGSMAEFRSCHEAGEIQHLPDLRSDLPEAFVRVVEKALATSPSQRYQSAGAFHRALSRAMVATMLGANDPARTGLRRRFRLSLPQALLWTGVWLSICGLAVWILWPEMPQPPALVFQSPILDHSHEAAFGASVDAALGSALRASPVFEPVSAENQLLVSRRMLRPDPHARFAESELAEAAQRSGARVILGGELVPSEDLWRLRLWLVSPTEEGRRLTAEQLVPAATTSALDGALDDALSQLEQSSRAWFRDESGLIQTADLEAATTSSLEALRLYTTGVRAYRDGEIEASEASLRRALRLDPDFALAHLHLGHSLAAQGNPESALRAVRRAYELSYRTTSDLERLTIAGAYFAVVRQYRKAIETYEQVLDIQGEDPSTLRQIAIAYRELGDLEKSIFYARRGRYDDGAKSINHGFLVYSLATAGRPGEALREAEGTRSRFSTTPYLLLSEALAYLGLDQLDKALETTRELESSGSPIYRNLASWMEARIRIYAGDLDRASEVLYRDRRTDAVEGTDHLEIRRRYWSARCLWLQGRTAETLAVLRSLDQPMIPSHLTGWRSVAAMRAELGDIEGSRQVLDRLEEVRAEYPSLLADRVVTQVRAEILLAQGDAQGALDVLSRGEAQSDVSYLRSLARCHAALGDPLATVEYGERLIARRGELIEEEFAGLWVEAQVRQARSLERLGRTQDAQVHWRIAREFWGEQADRIFGEGGTADVLPSL